MTASKRGPRRKHANDAARYAARDAQRNGDRHNPKPNDFGATPEDLCAPDVLAKVTEMAGRGVPLTILCRALGMTTAAFAKLCKEHDAFREAYEHGRSLEEEMYLENLRRIAADPDNRQAAATNMFLLKSRFKYVDNHRPTAPSVNITLPSLPQQPMTRDEYLRSLQDVTPRDALPAPESA